MKKSPPWKVNRHFVKAGFIRTYEEISGTFTALGKDIMFSKQKFMYFIYIYTIKLCTRERWKQLSSFRPVTDPLREEVTDIPCHMLLSSISLRTSIILEREQGVSIKGKNIRYSNGRTPIKSLSYSSPLEYELSLLFGSACRASPKLWKKRSA